MIKKITVLILAFSLAIGMTAFAESIVSEDGDYEYTKDGTLVRYYGEGYAFIPSNIDGTDIVRIGEQTFFDLGIWSTFLCEGIEEIGESAFEGCNVESVSFPETLKVIGDKAFENCELLNTVYLTSDSDAVTIGENAFFGTGHINFFVMCTKDDSLLYEKLEKAKGDNNFTIKKFHYDEVDVEGEKDIFGSDLICCSVCGVKESRYFNDVTVPFGDVSEESWYYPYVAFAYCSGIINGKSEDTFDPDGGMTCAEAVKIAASIHAYEEGAEIEAFGFKWYDRYVKYCYDNGIIEDYVSFDWDSLITRAQMAYLFSRCDVYEYYLNEVPITDIPDVYDTTPFAYDILDLYDRGVAVGDNDMSFYPDNNIKRSEAAALVTRILAWDLRIELPKG